MQLALPCLAPVISVMKDPCHGDVGAVTFSSAIDQYQNTSAFFFYLYFNICDF